MAVALALDGLLGWPNGVYLRIGHPVTWLGRLIAALDARWNRKDHKPLVRRAAGAVAAMVVIALASLLALAVQVAIHPVGIRLVLLGVFAWPFLAVRSLYQHVAAVVRPLQAKDMGEARRAVSMIVGRDPSQLDEAGIARAAIESLAENTCDGVVAPIFWGVLLGLPGIVGYKAINTLDSMIGHRTGRHEAFGWAAARIDDLANFIPARLTAALFALVAARPPNAFACMARDARRHRSVNAGWPEAAMAGGLSVRLCGPRVYHGVVADESWLNGSARDPGEPDIVLALRLYGRAMIGLAGLLVVLTLV
jgi:adenosylcobinamide-phosphate synthase